MAACSPRPKSAVSQLSALLSLLGMVVAIGIFRALGLQDPGQCLMLVVAAVAAPHVWAARSNLESASQTNPDSIRRVSIKCIGLLVLYGLIAASYFLFQGFYEKFVQPLPISFLNLGWVVLITGPFYIYMTDGALRNPEDGLYHWGSLVTLRRTETDWTKVRQFLLGWVVKGFFAPLMLGFALKDIQWVVNYDIAKDLRTPLDWYSTAYRLGYLVDVAFATAGYLCTFRLFNAHIRSTEPTMFGWVVCILCYPPFWTMASDNFLKYEDGYYWGDWLANQPLLWSIWAVMIVMCVVVYAWATVSFGMRFSNLTNRGILTNGPYRWLKHPAYVSKNISWWLISVPVIGNGTAGDVLRNCLVLVCLNAIYLLRAKTEERHLMSDPGYVDYCAWMKTNSLYAKISRPRWAQV